MASRRPRGLIGLVLVAPCASSAHDHPPAAGDDGKCLFNPGERRHGDRPSLVFLHYYGGSSRTWGKVIAAQPRGPASSDRWGRFAWRRTTPDASCGRAHRSRCRLRPDLRLRRTDRGGRPDRLIARLLHVRSGNPRGLSDGAQYLAEGAPIHRSPDRKLRRRAALVHRTRAIRRDEGMICSCTMLKIFGPGQSKEAGVAL
jgi:hypothetical protein